VVESENRAGFATALRKLLADPALGARLGEAGRARAAVVFRFDRMVDAYERVYAEALGKS
jgi:glycosyltransferase involved in cell wall biosynthesis